MNRIVAPTFSIIMPIYNVERYLAEAIESVIGQTIGFEDNVELILVNDGSPDGSETICLNYQSRFPKNIRYIYQSNQGVSAARNHGIDFARGEYLGFLDPDDKYQENALEAVSEYFGNAGRDLDVVSIPVVFFGAREGIHPLSKKFESGTRVVDVTREWQSIQAHVSSSFLRRDSIVKYGVRMDSRLIVAEDRKFLTQLIMRKQKYGLLAETKYLYRKREEENSAIDTGSQKEQWFSPVLEYCDTELFDEFRDAKGYVPRYVQNGAAYEIQWRLKQKKQRILKDYEEADYIRRIKRLLRDIDIDVILKQRHIYIDHKLLALRMKFGENVLTHSTLRGNSFYYRGKKIWSATEGKFTCVLDRVEMQGTNLFLAGTFRGVPFEGIDFGFIRDGKFVAVETMPAPEYRSVKFLDRVAFQPVYFRTKLIMRVGEKIRPAVRVNGKILKSTIEFRKPSGFVNGSSTYRVDGRYILQNGHNDYIALKQRTRFELVRREASFLRSMAENKELRGVNHRRLTIALVRILRLFHLLFARKDIWVISDRPGAAGDNGEAFFAYVAKNCPAGVKPIFLLAKTSSDFARMRNLGKVVDPTTLRGKLTILCSSLLVSSQIDDHVVNPFGIDWKLVGDCYTFDFVFLQHGIMLHDQSGWLNSFEKRIALFVTSSERERKAILEGAYFHEDERVVLTGLPRHDRLANHPKKKLVIAPTWRLSLSTALDHESLERPYNPDFADSQYYHFFQDLMNDKRLHASMVKHGYSGQFLIHPSHAAQARDFLGNDRFEVSVPPHDYRNAFNECSVFVTDYSSVAFDVAYLRKEVIYAQFDRAEFYGGHIYEEGYFSFRDNGFGPLAVDYESTVQAIIEKIESGESKAAPLYRQRMDDFFAYDDSSNSRRLMDAIVSRDLGRRLVR